MACRMERFGPLPASGLDASMVKGSAAALDGDAGSASVCAWFIDWRYFIQACTNPSGDAMSRHHTINTCKVNSTLPADRPAEATPNGLPAEKWLRVNWRAKLTCPSVTKSRFGCRAACGCTGN